MISEETVRKQFIKALFDDKEKLESIFFFRNP